MKQCRFFAMLLVAAMIAFSSCGGGGSGDGDGNENNNGGGSVDVEFLSAVQTGGSSGTVDSAALTLTFSADPATLTANNITVTGATKGVLSGTGTTRTLGISAITVDNEAEVSVEIASPSGYTISGAPKTATVYRLLSVGMPYQGGVIAYILQNGDPGFVTGQTHGLIAATSDQSTGVVWAVAAYQSASVDGTDTVLGTGSVNTDRIIAQNGVGTAYAAGLARVYNGGSYTDWYLPSKDELNKLFLKKVAVGGFANNYYLSSSQMDANYAWSQNFSGGYQGMGSKNNPFRVRAVRAF